MRPVILGRMSKKTEVNGVEVIQDINDGTDIKVQICVTSSPRFIAVNGRRKHIKQTHMDIHDAEHCTNKKGCLHGRSLQKPCQTTLSRNDESIRLFH